jgi:hypothetical protein
LKKLIALGHDSGTPDGSIDFKYSISNIIKDVSSSAIADLNSRFCGLIVCMFFKYKFLIYQNPALSMISCSNNIQSINLSNQQLDNLVS